tara:strand:- start:211 stop:513 length:303 start_codon:yes stop_codon:yes gene_type:complete
MGSETKWFVAHAAAPIAEYVDDRTQLLYGDIMPDANKVRLPDELGGGVRIVNGTAEKECPCGNCRLVTHLALGDNLFVARCAKGKFLWYSVKTDSQEEYM